MNNIKDKKEITLPVRVELSHLGIIDGYYFLNDILFNGFAYDHRDQQLYKVYQIIAGKISAEQDYGFFESQSLVKIDFAVIEDDYNIDEEMFYQGKPLNGITYEYLDGFVWIESLWIDGYIVEDICWYPDGSGLIRSYGTNYHEDECQFEWNYKQLKSVNIRKGNINAANYFSLTLNDQNQIKSCVLNASNIASLAKLALREDLPLPANNPAELLAYYPLADDILLNLASDENFNYFVAHSSFQSIKKLQLLTEYLSLPVLSPLMNLPHLTSLSFDEEGILSYDLQNLPEQERKIKQQQCDERNYALLTWLFSIQAKQHCDISLNASSTEMMFSYYQERDRLMLDVNQNDFNYLLNVLPLARIRELSLRQRNFPIPLLLEKLAQFSHLKKLTIEEGIVYNFDRKQLDDKAKAEAKKASDNRNQLLWELLVTLQSQLHCDIELILPSDEKVQQRYTR
ncbi:hypothetical protein [Apibacter adventoris]|uniref:Uncharacterized protein n=1 Tax=Apibacter adventoris TaxID=1679466 RepID=A0A2S8AAX1_9FLAO|nr:hypothetical protein [Apibacter adventoris]PQL91748.1 hypothetical protein C4S77_08075 [Apibacter adventoris]